MKSLTFALVLATGSTSLRSCFPEDLLDVREQNTPDDPTLASAMMAPQVSPGLSGSNIRPTSIRSGFQANGHAQSWDGRLFIGSQGAVATGNRGWYMRVFRPERVQRLADGTPSFPTSPSSEAAFSPGFPDASTALALETDGNAGTVSVSLNALAIVPHPDPDNPGFASHPEFAYDIHHNPFSSNADGDYDPEGTFETYELLVYLTDYGPPARTATRAARVTIEDPRTPDARLHSHAMRTPAAPLRDTSGALLEGIEPTATFDGRLILYHLNSVIKYSYNETPGAVSGWSVPRNLPDMHLVDREVVVAGEAFAERYPLAALPLRDHVGTPYEAGAPVQGAYPWISLDGTEVTYQGTRAGIPGVNLATRGGFTINGVATRYQARHVDGSINPNRDARDGKIRLFVSSPGIVPSFWFPFGEQVSEDGLPIPYTTTKPVQPCFSSNTNQYFEIPLEDALDQRYLTVLRMNEAIGHNQDYITDLTPDTSGNRAHGQLRNGAGFPIEAGLGDINLDGGLGRSVLFGSDDYLEIDDNPAFDALDKAFSAEMFVRRETVLPELFVGLLQRQDAFAMTLVGDHLFVQVHAVPETGPAESFDLGALPIAFDAETWTHLAYTVAIDDNNVLTMIAYQDGQQLGRLEQPLGDGSQNYRLVENSAPIIIGPKGTTNLSPASLSIDELKLSYVERTADEVRESAYANGIVDHRVDIASIAGREALLGKTLFTDPRLSGDGSLSCASCHRPGKAFTDGLPTPMSGGTRNVPTLLHRAHTTRQFFDGRADSLEAQVIQPIFDPVEMDNTEDGLLAVLRGNPGYVHAFSVLYGSEPTLELVARALANAIRRIPTPRTSFDRFMDGDTTALSESAQRGMHLFSHKARCSACHSTAAFTDELFHNTGAFDLLVSTDLGRGNGRFKTPTLRAIRRTAPYLHDGSVQTLEEVVELYDQGGVSAGGADIEIKRLDLTDQEKIDLVAFLRAL